MSLGDELRDLDAVASAALVAAGELRPVDLVDAAIERIEADNPDINAVITERYERARHEAMQPSSARFHGVPIVAKDYRFEVAGEPTSYGMAALRDNPVVFDTTSYFARQLRDAGFVVVGRANTPELAMSVTTEPLAFGPTRNPWDRSRSAAGSSGGSAAAVASAMVPVGVGTDGGGSLRIPAAACGIIGLKPSRGRVSLGPGAGEYWGGASTDGAISRTVRDAAAILDQICGNFPGDPYVAEPHPTPFELEVGRDPGRLRIAVLTPDASWHSTMHPESKAALDRVASLVVAHGHDVEPSDGAGFLDPKVGMNFGAIVAPEIATLLARLGSLRGAPFADEELEYRIARYRENGVAMSAVDYSDARSWIATWCRRVASIWAPQTEGGFGFDVLIAPTLNDLPPLVGATTADPVGGDAELSMRMTPFTSQANLLGAPAISIPIHQSSAGLPIGVQLIARPGDEATLLRLAASLENNFLPAWPAHATSQPDRGGHDDH